ncbi:MAG: hypothetical protein QOD70_1994, partial [Frankiales bacterium]|nr:hypothetical protein [Frankiales bacterium]
SEHKEGRAWDWGVSASNPTQVNQVNALLGWLLKTDQYGNAFANARRLGIMYVIWNQRIWKAYDPRWTSYSGADPHTGHVHFSFGWNGARKVTSYWDGTVAPIDWGSTGYTPVTPVRAPGNIAILQSYGSTVLQTGSSGTAVRVLQQGLKVTADGSFGPSTAAAVEAFQISQRLTGNGVVDAATWKSLFPPPIDPFGTISAVRTPAGVTVSGWAVDADTSDPLSVRLSIDGVFSDPVTADVSRTDVGTAYPASGPDHGFSFSPTVPAGLHRFCVTATNGAGTPGKDAQLGCPLLQVSPAPVGALETVQQVLGTVHVSGWALDPDSTSPVSVQVRVDGGSPRALTASGTHASLPAAWTGYGSSRGFATDLTLANGSHTVCASAVDTPVSGAPQGAPSALGCQTLTVQHNPMGAVERTQQVPGGIQVTGWAADPDGTAPTTATLTVDGSSVAGSTVAKLVRADLATRLGALGTAHGWSLTTPVAAGTHTFCATSTNLSGTLGAAGRLGCLTATVVRDARGSLGVVRTRPGGTVLVTGWALDPDTAATSSVSIRVDGKAVRTLTAQSTGGLPAAWTPWGSQHAYTTALDLPAGLRSVCVTALNAPGTPGSSTALGCRSVLVGIPAGHLDATTPGTGWVTVRGWALDPDTAAMEGIAISVDGRLVSKVGASLTRTDVAAHFPGYGSAHGFSRAVRVTSGRHTVCVTALNVTGTKGSDRALGCMAAWVR